jgi:hypothetical protein
MQKITAAERRAGESLGETTPIMSTRSRLASWVVESTIGGDRFAIVIGFSTETAGNSVCEPRARL